MTAFIIISSVLLLIALLLLIPIRARITYKNNDFAVYIYVWFLRFLVYPKKEKKNTNKKKKSKKPKPQIKPIKTVSDFFDKVREVKDVITGASPSIRYALSKVVVSRLKINLIIRESDAADTAVAYGRMSAYIYSAISIFRNFVNIKKTDVNIVPVYNDGEWELDFLLKCRILPINTLVAIIRMISKIVDNNDNKDNTKNSDKVVKNYGRSSDSRSNGNNDAKNQGNG